MALIFALSCCLCTAVNDLVFRLYARKSRSRGAYVLIIGLVWTLVFSLFLKLDFTAWETTLFWGIVSGVFSVVANILLIEGMGLSYKYAFMQGTDRNLLLVINGVAWIIGGALYAIYREKHLGEKFGKKKLEIRWSFRAIDLRNSLFYGIGVTTRRSGSSIAVGANEFSGYLRARNLILKGKIKPQKSPGHSRWNFLHTVYEPCRTMMLNCSSNIIKTSVKYYRALIL
jgi:hypothetical protein